MVGNAGELEVPAFVNTARAQMRRNEAIEGKKIVGEKPVLITGKELARLGLVILASVVAVVSLGYLIERSKNNGVTIDTPSGHTITEAQRNSNKAPGSDIDVRRGH